MFWILVILSLFFVGESVRLGKIDDYFVIGNTSNTLIHITEEQCICQMVKLNGLIIGANYFQINDTCQLFIYNNNAILIEFNLDSSFLFINQSAITITTILSTNIQLPLQPQVQPSLQQLAPPQVQPPLQQLARPLLQQPAQPPLQQQAQPPLLQQAQQPAQPLLPQLVQQPALPPRQQQAPPQVQPPLQQLARPLLQQPAPPPLQQPSQPLLQQPAQPLLLQPAQPLLQQPAQPLLLQQAQPPLQQPAQPLLLQPAQPPLQQPAQPLLQQPAQPLLQQQAQQPAQPLLLQQAQQPAQPPLAQQAQLPAQPPLLQPAQPLLLQQAQPPLLQPAQPPLQQPAQPLLQQPAQPLLLQPAQPPLQQPAQPLLQQPVQPPLLQPVQPPLQQQAQKSVSSLTMIEHKLKSFTVEAWIYPLSISTGDPYVDMMIYAQTSGSQIYQVMYMMLRNGTGYGAFYGDDVQGSTIFQALEWQHIAFTYDYTMTTQVIYINGVADAINSQAPPCLSTGGIQTIGVYTSYNGGFYNGYIDQLEISLGRAKSAAEILDDATLVAYYSMDDPNNPGGDSGPNQMTGVASGPFTSDQGRVGQSLLFYTNSSYIQITGLVLLGQSYSPFSVAVWIRPLISVTNGGTIVHFSDHLGGTGFCFPFIGLSSSGQIVVQIYNGGVPAITGPVLTVGQWFHIVETYSKLNGLRLYVNGILYEQISTSPYIGSGVPMIFTLGQPLNGVGCSNNNIHVNYYQGDIDELYIYSRELSQADITALANP
ncbi:unnamed protein product [Adineta steineri]|uniref:LamG-like jellyroll fold domain-containing protein n=1 Tax=Adineta steineri TaxID=433720 RepID=A0A814TD23_9BILA|nr:unnamed protein product [Adineta steineri]CAF3671373.1 unnamed protein product [Adineta steineri]